MLVSSVQAVVACYATAPRVCTSVLFIILLFVHKEHKAACTYVHLLICLSLHYMYVLVFCFTLFVLWLPEGEWISGAVCMYIVNHLLKNYDKSDEVGVATYSFIS